MESSGICPQTSGFIPSLTLRPGPPAACSPRSSLELLFGLLTAQCLMKRKGMSATLQDSSTLLSSSTGWGGDYTCSVAPCFFWSLKWVPDVSPQGSDGGDVNMCVYVHGNAYGDTSWLSSWTLDRRLCPSHFLFF